jgi:uncharacterized RDD family membrane protein YckC
VKEEMTGTSLFLPPRPLKSIVQLKPNKMTREEHLKFCRICTNQKFDMQKGIICRLTGQIADFEGSCVSFDEDIKLKESLYSQRLEREMAGRTASQGKRFANYLLDMIFYFIFTFIFAFIIVILLAIFSPSSLSIFQEENYLVNYSLAFIALMTYYTLFESITGRTLAKYITKTKVVDENGQHPGLGTIVLRSLCRLIPFEAFSFLGEDASGWHDKLTKTKVVEV